jgi:hypothetical protein
MTQRVLSVKRICLWSGTGDQIEVLKPKMPPASVVKREPVGAEGQAYRLAGQFVKPAGRNRSPYIEAELRRDIRNLSVC